MPATFKADPFAYPPRGMSRNDAARYVGVGESTFDEMVADRRMPKPRKIGSRTVWDRIEIDVAFSELPYRETNVIDDVLNRAKERDRARGIER
jgi:predicted DNA-binding transcriptional regulator AlpA